MYLTYDEYMDLGGTIEEETTFADFEFEAETILNWYTFNRLRGDEKFTATSDYDDDVLAVKRCIFRLIQLARIKAEVLGSASSGVGMEWSANRTPLEPTIASQSNDGVSISYNTLSASEAFGLLGASKGSDSANNEIEMTINRYLQDVKNSNNRKVLYKGLYPGE